MRFRPCIDLHRGKVKQIVGSTLSDALPEALVTNFQTDASPVEFASRYREDGLTGGHVIMLGPGNEDAARTAAGAFPGGLQVGGGITVANASSYLDAGASHVIVTSFVFRDGIVHEEALDAMVRAVGSQRLVLDLSCRWRDGAYWVVTDRWQKFTSTAVDEQTLERLAGYCAEFLVHAVDVEGKRTGIDRELIGRLSRWAPVPVTYAGGVSSIADLEEVFHQGAGRVDATVGSALDIFGGSLPYAEVVAWHRKHCPDGPGDR